MTITRVGEMAGEQSSNSGTLQFVATPSGESFSSGDVVVVGIASYNATDVAPSASNLTRVSGATIGTVRVDHTEKYNITGTEYIYATVYAVPITGADTGLTLQITGHAAYTVGGVLLRPSTSLVVQDNRGGTGASGAPATVGGTSTAAAEFFGVLVTNCGGATTHTADAAFTTIFEQEDGSNFLCGSVIDRGVGSGTTDAASWTAPTTVNWAASLVVYQEPVSAFEVNTSQAIGVAEDETVVLPGGATLEISVTPSNSFYLLPTLKVVG